jgi:hypothetical protein
MLCWKFRESPSFQCDCEYDPQSHPWYPFTHPPAFGLPQAGQCDGNEDAEQVTPANTCPSAVWSGIGVVGRAVMAELGVMRRNEDRRHWHHARHFQIPFRKFHVEAQHLARQ